MDYSTSGSNQPQAPAVGQATDAPSSVDINTLAALVQQFQQQQQHGGASAAAADKKKTGGNDATVDPAAATAGSGKGRQQQAPVYDAQSMMEEIAELKKVLEVEKSKSKTLQEEKKREMQGFLTGIRDYVNSLEGVKDPNAKQTFMQGIENMANHGIPNGIYDIMVSASAKNEQNVRTIEALTKNYTTLKDKYEGPGEFAQESSRFVDPTLRIVESGTKRKEPEPLEKVPLGMWDAFGEDVARMGYMNQSNLFV